MPDKQIKLVFGEGVEREWCGQACSQINKISMITRPMAITYSRANALLIEFHFLIAIQWYTSDIDSHGMVDE